jgi:hypothetical protein
VLNLGLAHVKEALLVSTSEAKGTERTRTKVRKINPIFEDSDSSRRPPTYSNPTSPGRVPSRSLGRGAKGRDGDILLSPSFLLGSPHMLSLISVLTEFCAGAKALAALKKEMAVMNFMVRIER